jgi:hypothetical protein
MILLVGLSIAKKLPKSTTVTRMLLKIYWSRNIPLKDSELSVSESDNV